MRHKTTSKFLRSTAFAAVLSLTCAIIGTSGFPSYADDTIEALEQKIKDNEEKIEEIDQKIAATEGNIAESEALQNYYWDKVVAQQDQINLLNNKLYAKEEEIGAKEDEIAAKEVEIADTEARIADKITEIANLDAQNRDNIYKFGQIIRTMYINDSEDVLSVLAGSTDFYDIFVRTEIMNSASRQNLEFMESLLDDIHRLEDEQAQLEADRVQLELDKAALEGEKQDLIADRNDLDEQRKYASSLSAQYNEEYNTYTAQIQDYEYRISVLDQEKKASRAEIEAYQAQIDEEIRKAQLAASGTVVYDDGEWHWPLDRKFHMITTYFGYSEFHSGNHGAIDIGNGGINGANIYAMKGGEVIVAKTTYTQGYDYGMYVVIDHGNGYQSLYAHCSAIYVTVGQMVSQGEVIASVGSTGWSTGPHLHFEIRKDGSRVDPLGYVAVPTD
ncbi:MAG: peptidoglycan DD-metalloendopeptidase family protein [Bacteroides sp.]|nr:peptidoglycan DD-metalloendopeptidase family protein [Eubacterium sp.]MCM1417540.1 peptidoglycan DD-metalloendopeptidase family protein [Roseburia sp.]MCM1463170.1 peptidoglycan DD-metalloendopeptidase family protein [Bacteroides sp.]